MTEQLQQIADYFSDAKLHEFEHVILKAISQMKNLEESRDWYRDNVVWGFHEEGVPQYYQGKTGEHEINDPITAETANKLIKALDIYKRERQRFQHAHPEITGQFFLTGGHGEKDDNMLPRFVTVCPAYGANFEVVYQKTDRYISYDGS